MVRLTLKQFYTLIRIRDGGLVPFYSKEYKSLLKRELITRDCKITEKGKTVLESIPE